jgi:hypothetical protein
MKTAKFFFAAALLSVAMISCQKENIGPSATGTGDLKTSISNDATTDPDLNPIVKYAVTVHMTISKPLCAAYQVVLLNGAGVMVAPPQPFIPGTTAYYFKEVIRQKSGVRIARIDLAGEPDNGFCPNALYTEPDSHFIQFENGAVYNFDLYPSFNPPAPKQ